MKKEVRANNGKSLLLPYPKMFKKKLSFGTCLKKAVRKKNESLFSNTLRETMK